MKMRAAYLGSLPPPSKKKPLLTQAFFNIFVKTQAGKLNDFSGQTQQTSSNSSQMNFQTHFIFSIFVVNEQKVLLFAQSAPKNAIFGAFLTDFPPKTAIFSKI